MKSLIFSYGSNSTRQLAARVGAADLAAAAAVLPNWVRVFAKHSKLWRGAVATIHPAPPPGHAPITAYSHPSARALDHVDEDGNHVVDMFSPYHVYGSVVELTLEQRAKLDMFEGGYHVVPVMPLVRMGATYVHMAALAYVADEPAYTGPPSAAYLTAISLHLAEHFNHVRVPILGLEDGNRVTEKGPTHVPYQLTDMPLDALLYQIGTCIPDPWVMPRTVAEICTKLSASPMEIGTREDLEVFIKQNPLARSSLEMIFTELRLTSAKEALDMLFTLPSDVCN